MKWLVLGSVLFFAAHSLQIVWPGARSSIVHRAGERAWLLSYAVVAGIGLVLIIWGYGMARAGGDTVYAPPSWGRHAALALMLPVFPLLLAAYLPGRIQRALGHPMLVATFLWALAHLLANGGRADVVLFGSFAVWAAADRLSFLWRPARQIRRMPARPGNDTVAVLAGLALYAFFVWQGHRWLTGVPIIAH